jgi:hypothetical protein
VLERQVLRRRRGDGRLRVRAVMHGVLRDHSIKSTPFRLSASAARPSPPAGKRGRGRRA